MLIGIPGRTSTVSSQRQRSLNPCPPPDSLQLPVPLSLAQDPSPTTASTASCCWQVWPVLMPMSEKSVWLSRNLPERGGMQGGFRSAQAVAEERTPRAGGDGASRVGLQMVELPLADST